MTKSAKEDVHVSIVTFVGANTDWAILFRFLHETAGTILSLHNEEMSDVRGRMTKHEVELISH